MIKIIFDAIFSNSTLYRKLTSDSIEQWMKLDCGDDNKIWTRAEKTAGYKVGDNYYGEEVIKVE